MEYTWEINGLKLELDLEDASTADRYAQALICLKSEKITQVKDEFNAGEYIRAYCKAFRSFYNNLFGTGTAERIFAEIPDNIRKYNEVYESLLEFVATQARGTQARTEKIMAKYIPERRC